MIVNTLLAVVLALVIYGAINLLGWLWINYELKLIKVILLLAWAAVLGIAYGVVLEIRRFFGI